MGFSLRSLFGLGTVAPSWSFSGAVKAAQSSTAVAVALQNGDRIDVTQGSDEVLVTRPGAPPTTLQWQIEGSQGGRMIYGTTERPDFHFVICIGNDQSKHLAGIIYSTNIGDDDDPGTWEADESGGGEDPPRG
jgi:hypothetical protein